MTLAERCARLRKWLGDITKYNYQRFKVAAEYDPYRTEYDYIEEEARKIAGLMKTTDVRNLFFGYAVRDIA